MRCHPLTGRGSLRPRCETVAALCSARWPPPDGEVVGGGERSLTRRSALSPDIEDLPPAVQEKLFDEVLDRDVQKGTAECSPASRLLPASAVCVCVCVCVCVLLH